MCSRNSGNELAGVDDGRLPVHPSDHPVGVGRSVLAAVRLERLGVAVDHDVVLVGQGGVQDLGREGQEEGTNPAHRDELVEDGLVVQSVAQQPESRADHLTTVVAGDVDRIELESDHGHVAVAIQILESPDTDPVDAHGDERLELGRIVETVTHSTQVRAANRGLVIGQLRATGIRHGVSPG